MPAKKGLVSNIKRAVARRRKPGEVFKVKKVVDGKDGKSKLKTTRSTGVTNSTRSKVRTSNMTKRGVDATRKQKATVTKDMKGNRVGTKKKTVSMKRVPGQNKRSKVGTIKKVKENYTTGKKTTKTKSVTYKKARRILKRMDKKTDRMINTAAKKTARQKSKMKY